jgi:hypothetical protein
MFSKSSLTRLRKESGPRAHGARACMHVARKRPRSRGPHAAGPVFTLNREPATDSPALDSFGRPRSVWSALLSLKPHEFARLASLALDCTRPAAGAVLADVLLHDAVTTDAWARTPAGGWRVWIDEKRRAWVEVWP